MPVTGLRAGLVVALAASLWAATDAVQQTFDVFATAASELSAGSGAGFMAVFDKSMPGYEEFEANVLGLVQQADIQSSVEFLKNEGNDKVRNVELDWFVQLVEKYDTHAVTRRREVVKCRVELKGKRWLVVSLTPQSLFAPAPVK